MERHGSYPLKPENPAIDEVLSDEVDELDVDLVMFDSDESALRYIERTLGGDPESLDIALDQEAIDELLEKLPKWLADLGMKDSHSITVDDVEVLLAEGYGDIEDVEDLYFNTLNEVRQKFGLFYRVEKLFLMDSAEKIDPLELKKSQNDQAMRRLSELGISSDNIIDLRNSSDRQTRNLRRLSWLLTYEPALKELTDSLKKSKQTGDKIEIINTAVHTNNVLSDTLENLRSLDIRKLGSIDRLWREAEIRRLSAVLNISKSVCECLAPEDKS